MLRFGLMQLSFRLAEAPRTKFLNLLCYPNILLPFEFLGKLC